MKYIADPQGGGGWGGDQNELAPATRYSDRWTSLAVMMAWPVWLCV